MWMFVCYYFSTWTGTASTSLKWVTQRATLMEWRRCVRRRRAAAVTWRRRRPGTRPYTKMASERTAFCRRRRHVAVIRCRTPRRRAESRRFTECPAAAIPVWTDVTPPRRPTSSAAPVPDWTHPAVHTQRWGRRSCDIGGRRITCGRFSPSLFRKCHRLTSSSHLPLLPPPPPRRVTCCHRHRLDQFKNQAFIFELLWDKWAVGGGRRGTGGEGVRRGRGLEN